MARNVYGRRPVKPTPLLPAIQLSPTSFKQENVILEAEKWGEKRISALLSKAPSSAITVKSNAVSPEHEDAESPTERILRSSPRKAVYTSRKRAKVDVPVADHPSDSPRRSNTTSPTPAESTELQPRRSPRLKIQEKITEKETAKETPKAKKTTSVRKSPEPTKASTTRRTTATRSSTRISPIRSPADSKQTIASPSSKVTEKSPKKPSKISKIPSTSKIAHHKSIKSPKKKTNKALQPSPKLIKSRKSSLPRPEPKSPLLNSFFVESKSKPTWSPTKTPQSNTVSPLSNQASPLNPKLNSPRVSALTQKLQRLSDEPQPSNPSASTWSLFDDFDEDPVTKPRTTILKKVSLRSPRKEKVPENHRALLKFFESHEFQSKKDEDTDHESSQSQSPSKAQHPQSPRYGTMRRGTYGAQRSYLAERSNVNGEITPYTSDHDSTDDSSDIDTENNLKSITNLRAQGESAKFLDDFNFITEGIETKPSLFSFLELAMRLFEDDFLRFVKSRGLPNLQHRVDLTDASSVYVLGFILCKVSDNTHGVDQFDDVMVQIVKALFTAPPKITPKKASKSLKTLFKEFTEKLGESYTSQFVAVTLLIQNGLFLSDELVPGVIGVLSSLDLKTETDLKLYHMVLILLESYLSKQDTASSEFGKVYDLICEKTNINTQTDLLQLKLIIVFAVKKFEKVFDPALFSKALKTAIITDNNELQLLNIGLLVSLVEDPKCLKAAMRQENIKRLHALYSKASNDSIPYFSLLVGTLYAESQLKIRKEFHTAELDRIVLELQRFDKFDKLMSLQVQHILAHFST